MGNKNIKNNFEDNKNYNNTSFNDIDIEYDNKNINYKEIEFPLNNIQNIIKNNSKDCTNCYTLDRDIKIEYDKKNNIPSIYRCPVCLCIPFIIYEKKICYLCNCGYHKCSVDYFLTNFISYPINTIILKNYENYENIESTDIYFCQVCSKFIIDKEEHQKNYYCHPTKNINNIFQKIEEENYNYYEFERPDDYTNGKNIISETFFTIKFSNFIARYLNFNILEKIENCYKIFSANNTEMEDEELIEKKKLYLFSKYLYYVFHKNITENTLVFQIIINLYFITNQINKNNFLNDCTNCVCDIYYKFQSLISDNIIEFDPEKIIYDNYSKRYVLLGDIYWIGNNAFLITKKNDIENIFLKSNEHLDFSTVSYFKEWNKNIIIFKSGHKLSFIDIEDGKFFYEIYENNTVYFGEIKNIILIDNKYYIFHCKSKIIVCTFSKANNKNDNININLNINLNIDKINFNYKYVVSKLNCEKIYKIKKMLILENKSNLKFAKINKDGNDLEELFNLNLQTQFSYSYKNIQIIGKNKITIIYKQKEGCIIKFEIYDVETKQKIFIYNNINNRLKELLFIGGNYYIGITNNRTNDYQLNIYNSNNLKKISNLSISKNECFIFFRKNSEKYILMKKPKDRDKWDKLNYLVKIKNGNLEENKVIRFIYCLNA